MSDTSKKEFKRSFSGYVEICENMPTGMITVRGDLNSRKLKSAFSKVVGATLPKERKVTLAENSIAWMSPDELLIICGYDNVSDLMKKLQKELDYTKGFLKSVEGKLKNERFVNNAPKQVVAVERKKQADALSKITVLEEQIVALS